MSGTLTAEDTPGGGLTLVVSLPVAPPPTIRGPADDGGLVVGSPPREEVVRAGSDDRAGSPDDPPRVRP
jgi:hypothetical protein